MSIIERLRAKAESAEPITKADYLELVDHIRQIERGYHQAIARVGAFNCHARPEPRYPSTPRSIG